MLRAMNPTDHTQVNQYERMLLLLARSKLSGQPNPNVEATPSDTAALAIADVRLCFDYEPTRSKNENIVNDLVASHMRTVFSMPSHREYFRSGYPSEPILAEVSLYTSQLFVQLVNLLSCFREGSSRAARLLAIQREGNLSH